MVHTDINCLAVLQYAIGVLGVEHVIVCGHYGCGGIRCAMESKQHGLIDNWLRHVKDIYDLHKRQLNLIPDADTREARLVELNVLHQLYNVARTTIVQNAWSSGKKLAVHGWVYRLEDGSCTIWASASARPRRSGASTGWSSLAAEHRRRGVAPRSRRCHQ